MRKLKEGPCLQRGGQREASVLVAGGEVDLGEDRPIGRRQPVQYLLLPAHAEAHVVVKY